MRRSVGIALVLCVALVGASLSTASAQPVADGPVANLSVQVWDASTYKVVQPYTSDAVVELANGPYLVGVRSDVGVARMRIDDGGACGFVKRGDVVRGSRRLAGGDLAPDGQFGTGWFWIDGADAQCDVTFHAWHVGFEKAGEVTMTMSFAEPADPIENPIANLSVQVWDASTYTVVHPYEADAALELANGAYVVGVRSDVGVARMRMDDGGDCGLTPLDDVLRGSRRLSGGGVAPADQFGTGWFRFDGADAACEVTFVAWHEDFEWAGELRMPMSFSGATPEPPATSTPIPPMPTATALPTSTAVPTSTALPTATAVPPTSTPVQPTATQIPTATPEPTATSVPPTPMPPGPGIPDALRITNGTTDSTVMDTTSDPVIVAHHGTRLYCPVSHFGYNDPIVKPGEPNASHFHMFWGNSNTDAYSTAESLMADRRSSCEGGSNNGTAYWVPALFNEDGEAVLPESVFVYYKSFPATEAEYFDRTTIQPVPNGLKMLANQEVLNGGSWPFDIQEIFDDGETVMKMSIEFPECIAVDGNGEPVLESPDNIAHLAYSRAGTGNSNQCPDSHPYRIPGISYQLSYRVLIDTDWRLSSDGDGPQGASLHGDYFAAWDKDTMDRIVFCQVQSLSSCEFSGGEGGEFRDQLPERFYGPDGTRVYRYSVTLMDDVDRTPFGASQPPMLMSMIR